MTLSLKLHSPDRDDIYAYLDDAGLPPTFCRTLSAWASVEHDRGMSLSEIEDAIATMADKYRAGEIVAATLQ